MAAGGRLALERVEGSGWRADGVTLQWRWQDADSAALELAVERLQLEALPAPLSDLHVRCRQALVTAAHRTTRTRVRRPSTGRVAHWLPTYIAPTPTTAHTASPTTNTRSRTPSFT